MGGIPPRRTGGAFARGDPDSHASYQSPYITLQTVDLQGNAAGPNGRYPTCSGVRPSRRPCFDAPPYVSSDEAGSIPFLLIGRYLWVGASLSPQLMQGKTWDGIASGLAQGQDPVVRAVLSNGNAVIAAAICAVDGGPKALACRRRRPPNRHRQIPAKWAGAGQDLSAVHGTRSGTCQGQSCQMRAHRDPQKRRVRR